MSIIAAKKSKSIEVPASALFDKALAAAGVSERNRPFYQLWVKKYSDFCDQNGLSVISEDTLPLYLSQVQSQVTEAWRREQAEKAVQLFLEIGKKEPVVKASPSLTGSSTMGKCDNVPSPWDAVIAGMEKAIKLKHYSPSTLKNYTGWAKRFRTFINDKDPKLVLSSDAKMFLEHCAIKGRISGKTQNLAFNALLFLCKNVLDIPFDNMAATLRAKTGSRLPEVLSVDEVRAVLNTLEGPFRLIAELLYGCGLRLNEGLNLRIKDIDFAGKNSWSGAEKGTRTGSCRCRRKLLPVCRK